MRFFRIWRSWSGDTLWAMARTSWPSSQLAPMVASTLRPRGRTWPGVSAMMAASNFQLPTSTTATVPVSARSIMCAAAARLVETAVPSGLTPAMPAASSSARRASGLAHAARDSATPSISAPVAARPALSASLSNQETSSSGR